MTRRPLVDILADLPPEAQLRVSRTRVGGLDDAASAWARPRLDTEDDTERGARGDDSLGSLFMSEPSVTRSVVAVHEAGHAVMAVARGFRVIEVTIIADNDAVGRLTVEPRPLRLRRKSVV